MALGAWLLWGGLGSFAHSKSSPSKDTLAIHVGWLALAAPVSVLLIRLAKLLLPFGNLPGLFYTIIASVALLFLPCWPVGAAFRVGSQLALQQKGASEPARLYFIESLGAFVAGALLTYVLLGVAPGLLILTSGGSLLLAATHALLRPRRRFVMALLLALSLLLLVSNGSLDARTRAAQFKGYPLLAQRESRYEHVAVGSLANQKVLFQNGVVSMQFPDPESQEAVIHWPLLAHPSPESMLLLGAGALPAVLEVFKHPGIQRLEVVEPDPIATQMLIDALPGAHQAAIKGDRVNLHHADPRAWVEEHPDTYDIVLHTYPEPLNASLNRLFTEEFFVSAGKALRAEGLLGLSVPSSPNYVTPEIAYTNASVLAALRSAFKSTEIIAGKRMVLIASNSQLDITAATLTSRYQDRGLDNETIVASNFPFLLDSRRAYAVRHRLDKLTGVEANTDLNPVSYFYTWRVWLSMFVSPSHFVGLALAVFVLLFGVGKAWRLRKRGNATPEGFLMFALGFSAMCVEVILLINFQASSGALYWQLGILLGVFMAGLSLGSGLLAGGPPPGRSSRSLLVVAVLLLAIGSLVLSVFLPQANAWFQGKQLLLFSLLLASTGFLLGAAFPLALACEGQDAPSLYAADLGGAALGAFVSGAFLVPLLGLQHALFLVGLLLACAVVVYLPLFRISRP